MSRIDPATNAIVLGRREDLETREIPLDGGTLRRRRPAGRPRRGRRLARRSGPQVRIRHRAPLVDATVRPATAREPARGGRWIVETDTPVWAIAPGQACVLYDGDACLGGGRIAHRRRRRTATPGGRRATVEPAGARRMTIGPGLPLALLVGLVNTAIYVLIRGDAGGRLPLTYVAAALGAWAGAAIGGRLGIDILAIGDFALIPASILAWVGIGIVAVLATLGPQSQKAR